MTKYKITTFPWLLLLGHGGSSSQKIIYDNKNCTYSYIAVKYARRPS